MPGRVLPPRPLDRQVSLTWPAPSLPCPALPQSPHRQAQALYAKGSGQGYQWRGYVQVAPNGSAAFMHRSWYTKYDSGSDDLRPVSHVTVGLSGGREFRRRAVPPLFLWHCVCFFPAAGAAAPASPRMPLKRSATPAAAARRGARAGKRAPV